MKKWDPNWTAEKVGSYYASRDNYWAGAKKACDDIGMSLPDKSKLYNSLAKKTKAEKEQLGLPTDDWFWSSSEIGAGTASVVYFGLDGTTSYDYKSFYSHQVLCVGD